MHTIYNSVSSCIIFSSVNKMLQETKCFLKGVAARSGVEERLEYENLPPFRGSSGISRDKIAKCWTVHLESQRCTHHFSLD